MVPQEHGCVPSTTAISGEAAAVIVLPHYATDGGLEGRLATPITGTPNCRVDDCEIGQFEQLAGDHFDGQFEGRMAL